MSSNAYIKSKELLLKTSSSNGFLASALDISNYKRVWARDGVICGLAALASGDEELINTFELTLKTLATHQHEMGTIPSNVSFNGKKEEVSYGGLAGRVDAVTWFIIGVCQLAYYKNDPAFVNKYKPHIEKCLHLLNAWEFNNQHLMYVPLSGNWADEYITEGYVLYDQLLRLWALKSYNHFVKSDILNHKIKQIKNQVDINFIPDSQGNKIHEKAYASISGMNHIPASFSPSGYKTQFDAFANSLFLLLNIGNDQMNTKIISYCQELLKGTKLQALPAFWPPVEEKDEEWSLLKNNCKYEFRNFPYEFHNGGTWAMVNGFYGIALCSKNKVLEAKDLLHRINTLNAVEDFFFYENFNSQTGDGIGVAKCAWSAAATVMLHQTINNEFKFLVD